MITTRGLAVACVCSVIVCSSGCLTCCAPNFEMYPAYGGSWERTNRTHGRVGSIIEPAGVLVAQNATPVPPPEESQREQPKQPESDLEPLELPPLPGDLRPADPAPPLDEEPSRDEPQLQTQHLGPAELLEQAGGPWSVRGGAEAQASAIANAVKQTPVSNGPRLLPALPDEADEADEAANIYQPLR